jgi:hypothetical protein
LHSQESDWASSENRGSEDGTAHVETADQFR